MALSDGQPCNTTTSVFTELNVDMERADATQHSSEVKTLNDSVLHVTLLRECWIIVDWLAKQQ